MPVKRTRRRKRSRLAGEELLTERISVAVTATQKAQWDQALERLELEQPDALRELILRVIVAAKGTTIKEIL